MNKNIEILEYLGCFDKARKHCIINKWA